MDYLGKRYNHKLGLYQQALDLDINWSIWKQPLYFDFCQKRRTVQDKVILVRSDTGGELGIVSKTYEPITPIKLVESAQNITHLGKIYRVDQIFGGRRFWVVVELENIRRSVHGNEFQGYLVLSASCDGTLKSGLRFLIIHTSSGVIVYNKHLTKYIGSTSPRINPDELLGVFTPTILRIKNLFDLHISGPEKFLRSFLVKHNIIYRDEVEQSKQYKDIMNIFADTDTKDWWSMVWAICYYLRTSTRFKTEDNKINALLFGKTANVINDLVT